MFEIAPPLPANQHKLQRASLPPQTADPAAQARGYHVVRLNGLLHSDDKVALKEISRQVQQCNSELDREIEQAGKCCCTALVFPHQCARAAQLCVRGHCA